VTNKKYGRFVLPGGFPRGGWRKGLKYGISRKIREIWQLWQTRVGSRNQMANMTERSVRGGDAAFYQITLITCFLLQQLHVYTAVAVIHFARPSTKTAGKLPGCATCQRKKCSPAVEEMMEMLRWISCSSWAPVSRPVNHCISAQGGAKRNKS